MNNLTRIHQFNHGLIGKLCTVKPLDSSTEEWTGTVRNITHGNGFLILHIRDSDGKTMLISELWTGKLEFNSVSTEQ